MAYFAAEKFVAAADCKVVRGGETITLTVSAGVSTVAPSDRSLDDCVQRADAALYRAKANGRNCTESSE